MKSNRWLRAIPVAVVIAASFVGCSDDAALASACCAEFKVGASIGAEIGGSAESKVAVQAVADFAGIASAAVDDITAACRSIAQDLDAPGAERDTAEANRERRDRMNAWCSLAVSSVTRVKAVAKGVLTVDFVPPVCEASIRAKATCQASCSGAESCDLQANPPVCNGGGLQVACRGTCNEKANAPLTCEGKCDGDCRGSCTAEGGVACAGTCNGTCTAAGGVGSGIKADGRCEGVCEGTCDATAPPTKCEGTCRGECTVSCTGTVQVSVKCDGDCVAEYEPISCQGGTLTGGCKAEAKCEGNCDASVRAKANCNPPTVRVSVSGAVSQEAAARLQSTLEANLGIVIAFQTRLGSMLAIATKFGGNVNAVTDIKRACILPVVAAVTNAVTDVEASFSAAANLVTSANR